MPRDRTRITLTCERCGATFERKPSDLTRPNRGRYCSRSCANSGFHTGRPKPKSRQNIAAAIAAKKGRPAWNRKERVEKPCEHCGTLLLVGASRIGRTRFCSPACMYAASRTITGLAHPLYTRVDRTCEHCGKVVKVKPAKLHEFRFCSRRCLGSFMVRRFPRISGLERSVASELVKRTIPFESQYPIDRYCIDIALPAYRLAVEVDGTYWHGTEKQMAKDTAKDARLADLGWRVLRLKEPAIRANLSGCVDTIVALITPPIPQPL